MLTLSRETIEEMARWEDLGLHIEEFPFQYRGMTEEEFADNMRELGEALNG